VASEAVNAVIARRCLILGDI